jgi:predicted ATPase
MEKIYLKIEVKDFGPITKGKITLKPLTIFIGPNNSGKSYITMLIHSIYKVFPLVITEGRPFFLKRRFYPKADTFFKDAFDLRKELENLKSGEELEIPQFIIEKITNIISKKIYEDKLSAEVVRAYACPLEDLIQIGKKSFKLKIEFNSYSTYLGYKQGKIDIKKYPQIDIKIKVKAIEAPHLSFSTHENENSLVINVGRVWDKERNPLPPMIVEDIYEYCLSYFLFKLGKEALPCYYLPAARSGILQGHRVLAASIVERVPYAGIVKLPEIPKFSGCVSDFIAHLLTMPGGESSFYVLAQEMEKELIKGEIKVLLSEKYHVPEIKYNFKGTEIPLHRTSSTVSELAPLFMYLKYIIEPKSILIIEEPEAHLHPENQRILAKYLVRMIRNGLNIIITTHSEYLLEQLNTFILLHKIGPEGRKGYEYREDDFLKPEEISVYVFEEDKKRGGYQINEVEITEEDGISQEEFLKVHEVLYEEAFKIRKNLSGET